MANEFTQAINDISWLAKRLSGVLALVPVLEKIGSLDQAITEKQKIVAELDTYISEDRELRNRLAQEVDDLKSKAAERVKEAEAEYKRIVDEAETKARQKEDEANRNITKAFEKYVEQEQSLQLDIARQKEEFDLVTKKVAERSQQLINIEDKLQRIKETLR